eukprot:scaffold12698_cov67-Skeletonema_dohrnii-CCMP3373.AAC.1
MDTFSEAVGKLKEAEMMKGLAADRERTGVAVLEAELGTWDTIVRFNLQDRGMQQIQLHRSLKQCLT